MKMSEKQAYEKKLQAKLDEWSAEIDKLKAKADSAGADLQLDYNRRIEDLLSMQKAANERLVALRDASDDAWQDLKVGMESAVDSLGNALRSARTRF
jgi:hypothetical protein